MRLVAFRNDSTVLYRHGGRYLPFGISVDVQKECDRRDVSGDQWQARIVTTSSVVNSPSKGRPTSSRTAVVSPS